MTAPAKTRLSCPLWCTRPHNEAPDQAIVHEDEPTVISTVKTPVGNHDPQIVVVLSKLDGQDTLLVLADELYTLDAAVKLRDALDRRIFFARAAREMPR